MVIPDRSSMIKFAAMLEKIYDAKGWDQQPTLGMVSARDHHYVPDGLPPLDVDRLTIADPIAAMEHFAAAWMKSTQRLRQDVTKHDAQEYLDRYAGVWFVSEGWMVPEDETDDRVVSEAEPDGIETRWVIILDCAGRLYEVIHRRGEAAHCGVDVFEPDEEWDVMRCGLHHAMRRILLAIGTAMSSGAIDMEKVGKAGVA